MILSSITHEARRQHQCAFCGLSIPAGQQYVRAPVPGGGRLAKRAFHTRCYTGLSPASTKLSEQRRGRQIGNKKGNENAN